MNSKNLDYINRNQIVCQCVVFAIAAYVRGIVEAITYVTEYV
jgi:hypothetical protein